MRWRSDGIPAVGDSQDADAAFWTGVTGDGETDSAA
jgi:hypothetical protein